MIRGDSILVSLGKLVDRLPWPPEPAIRPRGCPRRYSDRLMMQALVIMIMRRSYAAYAWLRFLEQDDPVPAQLRQLLVEQGRFPSRRTWQRRLAGVPTTLPGRIGSPGRHLVALLQPWTHQGRAVSLESTAVATAGGGWHTKHRALGAMPHSAIDTAAGGSTSGWHGWWDGWKLHLAVTVGAVWIPLAAELTVANPADKEVAPRLLEQVPLETR